MSSLSVIIITLNEERNLRRCLESVKFADEIIINDTGSTDGTLKIARGFECRIIQTEFAGFGKAKQTALEAATCEWVLSVDADEELDNTLQTAVKRVVEESAYGGYLITRKSRFLGNWIMHSGWYPDRIVRLFRRTKGRFTEEPIHEKVVVDGLIGNLDGHLLHYAYRDLSHYLEKLDNYATLKAETLRLKGTKFAVSKILFKPTAVFIKMYILKRGFLDGKAGLILALLSSFHEMVKHAKLWELERR